MEKAVLRHSALRDAVFSLVIFAIATPAAAQDLAYRLYKESGMQTQLQSMSAAFDQGFTQYAQAIPEKTLKDMIKIGKESFDEPAMGKIIVAHLSAKLSKNQLQKALEWQSTKTARKITQLENAASTPEGQLKVMAYAQQLETKQPDPAYIERIQQLAIASKSVDLSVEIAANIQISMGAGMAMAKGESVNLTAIAAEIENAKPQMHDQMAKYVLVSMLYTYQDLSKKELDNYIEFVRSPAGTSFYTAIYSGLNEAFIKVGKNYGRALGQYFEQDAKQIKS